MSSSTISTHGAGRVSSLALLSGEKLEHRLEELLQQERFAPPRLEPRDLALLARPHPI